MCPDCGAPIVEVVTQRGPWRICVNMDCPGRKKKEDAKAARGTKRSGAKKTTSKKTAAKKTTAKKSAATRKSTAKKAPAKKTTAADSEG